MKSIIVKRKNGVASFMSGWCSAYNPETEEHTPIERTEEEELQSCYEQLERKVEDEIFEKNLISLFKNYISEQMMDGWTKIKIEMTYTQEGKYLEKNIINLGHK